MRSYWMEAYGCQMSKAESDAIESLLLGQGWTKASVSEQAQAVILNTCSVRQTAENRIWGRLGFFAHQKSVQPLVLILTGCMAERIPEELSSRARFIDYIIGTNDKMRIVDILNSRVTKEGVVLDRVKGAEAPVKGDVYEFAKLHYSKDDVTAYVPIMNGCNNFCSYCIVPYVRGREISRSVESIIDEIKQLDAMGVHEVQLLGQNVNSYKYGDWTFARLLTEICRHLVNIQWVRFDSPHPKDFGDDVIEVLAREPRIAHHYHIPLQSGSDRILQLMNRRYDVSRYLDIIDKIKAVIPDATFSTDVMVGFPSETEEEAEQTRKVMERVGFIEAFMYYWNPREGTRANDMEGQISEKDKVARLQKIIDFQLANCALIKRNRVGDVQKVLVTQVSRDDSKQMLGRNEHSEMVAFDARDVLEIGSVVSVKFNSLNGNTFQGVLEDA
ncbi:MAG: tRNA (N6-isopentenyl adenosine(37)-C2)-methylthiotransferase MiaB [Sphaerochaetaceae bacterium]|nr:tRNA (N6-isopentenyl adenosine(37)-C2)-methylthiotransferase MiaB [Sphaerochaetaceae bacterium]